MPVWLNQLNKRRWRARLYPDVSVSGSTFPPGTSKSGACDSGWGKTHLYSPKVSSFIGRASESTSLSSLSFTVGKHLDVNLQCSRVCVFGFECVVCLTCVFAALAAFDKTEDEQYQHQQHDGADESNQPTLGGETTGHHVRHWEKREGGGGSSILENSGSDLWRLILETGLYYMFPHSTQNLPHVYLQSL